MIINLESISMPEALVPQALFLEVHIEHMLSTIKLAAV